MNRILIILISIIIGKYADCSGQTYTVKDLYGFWISPDRSPGVLGFSAEDEATYDDETTINKRRSLFISPEEIAYIHGGFEIVDELPIPGTKGKRGFMKAKLAHEKFNLHLSSYENGTLNLQVVDRTEKKELKESLIQVVFEDPDLANFKIGEHDFVKLSRRHPPELLDYLSQFGFEHLFRDGAFQSYLPEVQRITSLPSSLCHVWHTKPQDMINGQNVIFTFLPDGIHTFEKVWKLDEAFQFDSTMVIIGKSSSRKKAFVINQYPEHLDFHTIDLTTTSPEIFEAKLTIAEGNRVQIKLEELPSSFFRTYSHLPSGVLSTIFTGRESFSLNKLGEVSINQQTYKVNHIYELKHNLWGKFQRDNIENIFVLELVKDNAAFLAKCFIEKGKLTNISVINHSAPKGYFTVGVKPISKTYLHPSYFNWLLFFELFGLTIVLAIAGVLLYRSFILPRRLKNRLTTIQFEGVKSQLNPHFLFNSMASIQSLMNQRKTMEANRYLNELSDLLRYHLDTGAEELVPLSEELSAIEHYCELEKLRSPFKLDFEIDERLDPDRIEVPNQLLQPIVENAIKHGLCKVDDPKLRIRVQQLEKRFVILIEDNGPGIGKQEKVESGLPTLRKTHKGLGLVREKIALLKKRGMKVKFDIEDRQNNLGELESGTLVRIEIPFNL